VLFQNKQRKAKAMSH